MRISPALSSLHHVNKPNSKGVYTLKPTPRFSSEFIIVPELPSEQTGMSISGKLLRRLPTSAIQANMRKSGIPLPLPPVKICIRLQSGQSRLVVEDGKPDQHHVKVPVILMEEQSKGGPKTSIMVDPARRSQLLPDPVAPPPRSFAQQAPPPSKPSKPKKPAAKRELRGGIEGNSGGPLFRLPPKPKS